MSDDTGDGVAPANALSDENGCLRDMLNDIAYALGLDMMKVRYRSEDDYAECQSVVLHEIEGRLMPGGMEWPRFEDGELVGLGDRFLTDCGSEGTVYRIEFSERQTSVWPFEMNSIGIIAPASGKRVKRPPDPVDTWEQLMRDEKSEARDYCNARGVLNGGPGDHLYNRAQKWQDMYFRAKALAERDAKWRGAK